MAAKGDRDYVLGTHDEELSRLGLQHRVWRPTALDCWHRAGITIGSRVLDVGADPNTLMVTPMVLEIIAERLGYHVRPYNGLRPRRRCR